MFQMGGPVIADPAMNMQPPPMQPPPVASQGIMTGIEDPQTEGGLTSVAEDLQQVMAEIDGAENYEGIMNALRGDQATIEQRRQELAQYVGNDDSVKTPESVLALTQPVVEILKVTEQAETDQMGGIASLGDPTVNFNQASVTQSPGLDEASMRIAQGEQFVQRANGSPPIGETVNIYGNPFVDIANPFDFSNIQNPEDVYRKTMGGFTDDLQMLRQALPEGKTYEERLTDLKTLGLRAPTARTTDEIVKSYKDAFGSDANYTDLMNNLNLVQASTGLMQDTRPFAEAVGGALEKYATGKIETIKEQRANERALQLAALQTRDKEVAADVERLNAAKTLAYKSGTDEESMLTQALIDTTTEAYKGKGEEARLLAAQENKNLHKAIDSRDAMLGEKPLSYMLKNGTIVSARATNKYTNGDPSPNGFAMISETGTLVPLAEGRFIDDSELAKRVAAGGSSVLGKNLQQVKMSIPITTQNAAGILIPSYKDIMGVYAPDVGRYYYQPDVPDQTTVMGQLDAPTKGEFKEAPSNFIIGKHSTDFTTVKTSGFGTTITYQDPNDATNTITTRTHAVAPNGTTIVDRLAPLRYKPLTRDANGQMTGTPYVTKSEVDPANTYFEESSENIAIMRKKFAGNQEFISLVKEFLASGDFKNTVGLTAGGKRLSNLLLGTGSGVFDSEWGTYQKTEVGKTMLTRLGRAWTAGQALSERYAMGEQEILRGEVAKDITNMFGSADVSAARLKEMLRQALNQQQGYIGFMTGQPITYLGAKPTGQSDDPYNMQDQDDLTYLSREIALYNKVKNPKTGNREIAKQMLDKFDRTFIRQSKQDLENKRDAASNPSTRNQLQQLIENMGDNEFKVYKATQWFNDLQ